MFKLLTIKLLLYLAINQLKGIDGRVAIVVSEIEQPRDEINNVLFEDPIFAPKPKVNPFYEKERNALIAEEQSISSGGNMKLSEKEQQVNDIFMRLKLLELSENFERPDHNTPGMHFFKAKPLIDRSKVFQFIREMPKGAILHVHNTASVSSNWVIKNLSYMGGMKKCVNTNGITILTFRENMGKHKCRTRYENLDVERQRMNSSVRYDKVLEQKINLHTESPEFEYNTDEKVWTKFQNMFDTLGDAIKFEPAFRAFHWRMLEEMYQDNIMYAEIRMRFKKTYDANGNDKKPDETIQILISIVEDFKKLHPDFLGIKIIYSTHRGAEKESIRNEFEVFKRMHEAYPHFIVGFDLVGQEDKGKALHTFSTILQDVPKTAKFFFHAGETNWYGSSIDLNLVDAILLNTTRIGHGFALIKHPVLMKTVKERGIGIEVTPISNQVLDLIWDLRNHPAGYFLADDMPIVISNDDPGFWNAKGLSYDFYYAIMSLAPNYSGLKTLKSLVWNSLKYSALNDVELTDAIDMLEQSWDEFLNRVLMGLVVDLF
ncbi:adenosine deaminase 2-like [Teleopsis dalmanni]|uniref:adenosine deaminase 2-like n=1 Tax=Teleopsis dalmanni TaxID=139649 RepID=UPI0018CEA2A3|nr:adenosine deaminase 2-like [Teleopsis dalmanni]